MNERRRRGWWLAMSLLPKAALSRLARRFAASRASRCCIAPFVRRYGIALDEAEVPPAGYATLAECFGRALKPGRRVLEPRPDALVSPVDGRFGACGTVYDGVLIQAKGFDYTAAALLADAEAARIYDRGVFLTFYLAPRDYHRVHAPVSGAVAAARYIAGAHWPVHPGAVRTVPRLFARNERLVTVVDTGHGPVALVMVGACIVGGLRVNYDRAMKPGLRRYSPPIAVARGGELGRFEFGSTVVLLLPRNARLDAGVCAGAVVRMGRAVAWWEA